MTKTDTLWNNFNDWMDDYDYKSIQVVVYYRASDNILKSDDEFFNVTEWMEIREYVRDELWAHIDNAHSIDVRLYDAQNNYHLIASIDAN